MPANLVSGFLGAGKTTTILHLLAHRPRGERWAVLVNDFGELGIDGATIAAGDGIAVREVAGGCICCTGNVPMRVALTPLVRIARPQRLLVEPTGLGHAASVYDTLASGEIARTVRLESVICMLDPQQAADSRIAASNAFRDQLALADAIAINKRDVATPAELENARAIAHLLYPPRVVVETELGVIDLALLDGPHASACGVDMAHGATEQSRGFRFARGTVFGRRAVAALFEGLNASGGNRGAGASARKGHPSRRPGCAARRLGGRARRGSRDSLSSRQPRDLHRGGRRGAGRGTRRVRARGRRISSVAA